MDTTTQEIPETMEEGYGLVKNLIFDQVHKFRRRYGGDLDDLVGEANVAFVRGHNALVARRAPGEAYPAEIRRWVWYELFDAMRGALKRQRKVRFSSTDNEGVDYAATGSTFCQDDFMEGLSPDARVVTELALRPPEDVAKTAEAKGGEARNYKSTARTHLRTLGWRTDRISAAFEEVAEALNG